LNTLRNNLVSVLLIIGVLAVTGLNHFTTMSHCELYLSGVQYINAEMARNKMVHEMHVVAAVKEQQLDRITTIAENESVKANETEAKFNELVQHYVQLRHAYQQLGIENYGLNELLKVAGQHIEECHRLLKEHNIDPPAFPVAEQGPSIEWEGAQTPATPTDKSA
jgi:hypothetical protein